uniref:Protein SCO1/2 n=1 Tax=Candidatus Kentrum sp. SD TaxID=2126332 RepID=A0A450YL64_9GAMM|nr:MAG: protein SCO1/2 [Candidatus Kentron sp. SD]VFK48172.1 MAG: protein SCO1/2 [Candidatus Kentron sp. SD]VFK77685.1 MAG: protein SCO1/2 [Candidatus Kentron sp. SD]
MNEHEQAEYSIGNFGLAMIGIALFAIVCLLFWFSVSQQEKSSHPDKVTTILGKPRPVPAFTLADQYGNPFTAVNLQGQWTFLYFGYTSCPDVCPTTLGALAVTDRTLREGPLAMHPKFVFISVDPERDTQEQLARYVPYFNPNFLGATGAEEEILALTRPLGIVYRRSYEGDSESTYLVDHSASVLLINPEGRMVATFSPPHDGKSIAEHFRRIAGEFESP